MEINDSQNGYWARLLSNLPPHQVGVIKASGKLLSGKPLEQLCRDAAILQGKGFYLPVVLGGGMQYDALEGYAHARKVNGLRVTSPQLIEKMVTIAQSNQDLMAATLSQFGVEAMVMPISHVKTVPKAPERNIDGTMEDLGKVGEIVSIDTAPIIDAIYSGKVPILSHLGVSKDGAAYNINATDVAMSLVMHLHAKKLIILGDRPVLDANQNVIPALTPILFHKLVAEGVIKNGMIKNAKDALEHVAYLGPGHSVQITALSETDGRFSTGLLEELLGEGKGTMITSSPLISSYPLRAVDPAKITDAISRIFSKEGMQLVSNYVPKIIAKNPTIYLDSTDRGGGVVYQVNGVAYICKLFVEADYEGAGIARATIDTVMLHKGAVAWRTNPEKKQRTLEVYDRIIKSLGGVTIPVGSYNVYLIGVPKEKQQETAEKIAAIPPTVKYT